MRWIIPGIFAATSLIIWPLLNLSLNPNVIWMVPILAGLYCCNLTLFFVRYRLRNDHSLAAMWLKHLAETVALFAMGAIPFILISLSFAVYCTLAIRLRWPLRDGELATLDAFIGFHWLPFLAFVNSSKIASEILVVAYHSFIPQFVFLVAILSLMRMGERITEFVTLYGLVALPTAALTTIFPAAGAYVHFVPSKDLFSNFTNLAGMWHYHAFVELRTADIMNIDLFHLTGTATFPSFHAAAAILVAYAARGVRFVAIPMLILNVLMIVSAVPEGGHYLVDVIAGVLIAVVCIIVSRSLRPIFVRPTCHVGS